MADRPVLVPDDTHPITIEPTGRRVTVRQHGQVVADSTDALTLLEAAYPPVYYVPRGDVAAGALRPSDHSTYCPYKGDASYDDLVGTDGSVAANAVWAYDEPYDAVSAIGGHVAFSPDAVTISVSPAD